MSCDCENKRRAAELERMRSLAKSAAKLRGCIMELRRRDDGTYSFNCRGAGGKGKIVEYIHYL